MGILDKLGNATRKIGEGTRKAGKTLSLSVRETRLRGSTKKAILERFTYADLEGVMRDHGLKPPKKYEKDSVTGKKIRTNVTKKDFVEKARQVPFKKVVAFSKRGRIVINDILEDYKKELNTIREGKARVKDGIKEKEEKLYVENEPEFEYEKLESQPEARVKPKTRSMPKPKTQSDFEKLIKKIERFTPPPFRDEKEFQRNLTTYLCTLGYGVKMEYPLAKTRVDLLVEDRYAFEVKLANKGSLQNAIGQLMIYKERFPNLGIVVVDVGYMQGNDIRYYINQYNKLGAKAAIVKGIKISKRKRRR